MDNWVVLFVRTGFEHKLKDILLEKLNPDEFLPFLPLKENIYRRKGICQKQEKLLFKGYIFIKSPVDAEKIYNKLKTSLKNEVYLQNIYSILHYGKIKNNVVMKEKEKKDLETLMDSKNCIRGSKAIKEGDKIQIISGPLLGHESIIKKTSNHNKEATIEIDMMGTKRELKVYLEVIEKL